MLNIYNQQNNHEELNQKINQKNGNGPKPNFLKFEDPTGELPSSELKWAIWFSKNRILLYKILVGSLIFVIVVLWGYSFWQWGDYLIFGLTEDQKMAAELSQSVDVSGVTAKFKARAIQINDTLVLPGGVNKYDVIADVTNPNIDFFVKFNYRFSVDGGYTEAKEGFILPGETKLLVISGLDNDAGGGAQLVLEKIVWKRVNKHAITDVKKWQDDRLNFAVENFVFGPPRDVDGIKTNRVTFDLKNNSTFGYRAPGFLLGMYQNEALVGVILFSLESWPVDGVAKVDLRNFVQNLDVSSVQVYPLINIYDNQAYLPLPS